jgi:hypothetical protein
MDVKDSTDQRREAEMTARADSERDFISKRGKVPAMEVVGGCGLSVVLSTESPSGHVRVLMGGGIEIAAK